MVGAGTAASSVQVWPSSSESCSSGIADGALKEASQMMERGPGMDPGVLRGPPFGSACPRWYVDFSEGAQ